MGSVVSLEPWVTDSIQGQTEWVKALTLPQLCGIGHNCDSNVIPAQELHLKKKKKYKYSFLHMAMPQGSQKRKNICKFNKTHMYV